MMISLLEKKISLRSVIVVHHFSFSLTLISIFFSASAVYFLLRDVYWSDA